MKNVTVSEFYLENGKKGQAFSGFDVNCLKGAQIPFFKTRTVEGDRINSNDLIGKVNVINFWFEACKPCMAEVPGLNIMAESYKNQGVNFIAISTDDDETLKQFLAEREFNFIHLLNGKDIIRNKFQHKSGFPTTIVADKNLEIVEIFTGGKSDSTAVKDIVNKLEPVINQLIEG